MNTQYNDEMVYEVDLTENGQVYLAIWFSDNPAESAGCDACIGYGIYGTSDLGLLDGGEMDYDSDEKDYGTIEDALADILGFAFEDGTVAGTRQADVTRDELED